jgi:isoleucyl-tRNA synthetase
LVRKVTECYENYDITTAGRLIQDFVCDNLSNWYVRLNRKRFWGGSMDQDKLAAYQTLYSALETVSILAAPIAPFFMDRLFLDLNAVSGRHSEISVHIVSMPEFDPSCIDAELEERMDIAQLSSSMVLALRRKVNINVRQPLAKMIIPVIDPKIEERFDRIKSLVLTEVNVKEVEYIKDTTGLITKKIKPNFRVLGKRYGKQMKEISSFFAQMSQQQIAEIEKAGVAAQNYSVELPSGVVELMPEDYEITSEDMPGWLVASEGKLTIALDITITEELKNEGIARELINRIQNLRKDSNFEVTDKINIEIVTKDEIAASVAKFGEYIASQTLAMNIKLVDSMEGGKEIEWLGDEVVTIKLERI